MIPETLTTHDNLSLFVKHWEIPNPKAVVAISHGIGEHVERYSHVADALNKHGYAVAGLDHRHHGKSEGEPRAYTADLDQVAEDFELLWHAIQTTYPDIPHFLLGHSMGGQIAVRFTLRNQESMQGLVASAPAFAASKGIPEFIIPIGRPVAKLIPKLPTTKLDPIILTHDEEMIAAWHDDSLIYRGGLHLGVAAEILDGITSVAPKTSTLKLPILILHGDADELVLPKASQRLYEYAGSADKILKIYPNLRHEIMNELPDDRQQVIGDIVEWLDNHLPSEFSTNG